MRTANLGRPPVPSAGALRIPDPARPTPPSAASRPTRPRKTEAGLTGLVQKS
jgi:hypothetical protein